MSSKQKKAHISHVCEPLTKRRVKDSKNSIPFLSHGEGSRGDEGISPWYKSSNLQELGASQHHLVNVQLRYDQRSS